jgi:hypothetical protein
LFSKRAAVAAILCLVFATCGADADSSGTLRASPDASSLIGATPSPLTAVASPSPVATPRPTPKPTPVPVPPKPSGVKLHEESEGFCDDQAPGDTCAIGDSIFRLSWQAPRTKGIEIRVYGVTTCFGKDSSGKRIDGHCLREHTALPSSMRVLLAKVPASKGKVTWRMDPGRGLAETRGGVRVYSIVLAAYSAVGGHSIFVIADAGDWRLDD